MRRRQLLELGRTSEWAEMVSLQEQWPRSGELIAAVAGFETSHGAQNVYLDLLRRHLQGPELLARLQQLPFFASSPRAQVIYAERYIEGLTRRPSRETPLWPPFKALDALDALSVYDLWKLYEKALDQLKVWPQEIREVVGFCQRHPRLKEQVNSSDLLGTLVVQCMEQCGSLAEAQAARREIATLPEERQVYFEMRSMMHLARCLPRWPEVTLEQYLELFEQICEPEYEPNGPYRSIRDFRPDLQNLNRIFLIGSGMMRFGEDSVFKELAERFGIGKPVT